MSTSKKAVKKTAIKKNETQIKTFTGGKSIKPAHEEVREIAEKLLRDGVASDAIGALPDGLVDVSLIRARLIYKSILKLRSLNPDDILGIVDTK